MKTTLEMVRLIEINAHRCYVASLCAGPPSITELAADLCHPQVGDLVMEITTFRHEGRGLEGIGRLLRRERRPTCTREQWVEAGGTQDEAIPTEEVWVLSLVFDDDREFVWHNAMFVKVTENIRGMK